ncbi:MAG: hypothetical protein NZM42_10560 [Gemmatales bacterium]|nr:hypothetical protein [Gemmatales bacterium]MDW8222733.1 hypothetical protein [Gemmatales bacterium]
MPRVRPRPGESSIRLKQAFAKSKDRREQLAGNALPRGKRLTTPRGVGLWTSDGPTRMGEVFWYAIVWLLVSICGSLGLAPQSAHPGGKTILPDQEQAGWHSSSSRVDASLAQGASPMPSEADHQYQFRQQFEVPRDELPRWSPAPIGRNVVAGVRSPIARAFAGALSTNHVLILGFFPRR